MSIFEHLLVVPSVIYGLTVTRLLQGVGECVHPRRETRIDWVHLTFTAYLLLMVVQEWWRSYEELTRRYENLRQAVYFYDYLIVVAVPVLLYLAAAMLIPDETSGEVLNLQMHYHRVRSWFFGTMILLHFATIFDDVLLFEVSLLSISNGLVVAGAAASAALAVTPRRWVHVVLAIGMVVGQVVHIAFFSLRINL